MQNHETHFVSLTHNIFHVNPFWWQRRVGTKILDNNSKRNGIRLLCVQPNGGGKTLVYQVVAALLKGVCIYISPVLSLGSDQVNKLIMNNFSDDTTIVPVHLEKVQNKKDLDRILSLIKNINNSTCAIIFEYNQIITTKCPQLVRTIKTLIWFVVVDQLHLFNSSGRSLRYEFSLLRSKFFSKLRKNLPMLFFTATCTQFIQASFKKIIGILITHCNWPSAAQLLKRQVTIYAHYSERPLLNISKAINKNLV